MPARPPKHQAPFHDLPTLAAWLESLPEPERIQIARLIADTKTTAEAIRIADTAIYEATRTATRPEVAARFQITLSAVNKAVDRIRNPGSGRRTRTRKPPKESP